MGLPQDWEIVEGWIDGSRDVPEVGSAVPGRFEVKNPEIPVLESYGKKANAGFWKSFPENYPTGICQKANCEKLKRYIKKHWPVWLLPQRKVAEEAVVRLNGEIEVKFVKKLGALEEKNAKSAVENGKEMTDAIASWVKAGFVAGPFEKPPVENFRANPMMAAVQRTKVRPIMNLASPKGGSFNEAVDIFAIKKLTMSSAKQFAESVRRAGRGAVFAKSDIRDAYKLIPNPKSQWRLYGFSWLGKYFLDTSTVFGSKAAPANFDCLADTVVNIVCSETGVDKKWIHRQLDDVPVVSKKQSNLTERFVNKYREVCGELNIPLAEECPNHEKAFGPSTYGTVLGVRFDTERMEWSLAKERVEEIVRYMDEFATKKACTLKEVQKLHGKLANVAQAGEFMKGFRYNILDLLGKFGGKDEHKRIVSDQVKEDLWVWRKYIWTACNGMPLGEVLDNPPLETVRYISDAAGAAMQHDGGKWVNRTEEGERGVASVRYRGQKAEAVCIHKWPKHLLTGQRSRSGRYFGSKSGTLEAVGLLLPALTDPGRLTGRHVVLEVDNLGVVFGWKKKHSKEDPETSLLLRCLHVLEARLACKFYVQHVKRCSTKMAELADKLTRTSTTDEECWKALATAERKELTGELAEWLTKPVVDWELPEKLCIEVGKLLK